MSIQCKFAHCTISCTENHTKYFSVPVHYLMHHKLWNRISSLNRSVSPPGLLVAILGTYYNFFLLLCCHDYASKIQLDVPILKFQSTEQILIHVYNTKKQAGILHTGKSKKGEVLCLKALGRNE